MIFDDFWNILWIPLLVPPLIFFHLWKRRRGEVRFSALVHLKKITPSLSLLSRHLLLALRVGALVLLVIALMRPRQGTEKVRLQSEGVDILLAIDVSGSMKAEDFSLGNSRRNRLDVIKEVVREFIQKRKNDRIGIVVFGGRAYTLCPLTLDQGILLRFLERVKAGMVEDDTAIGDGLVTSLNRLRKIKAKSKVVVLLTDGVQNAGKVDAKTAAEMARALGMKVYTIGVGSKGPVPFPMQDPLGRTVYQLVQIDLDEELLCAVAERTGGAYYRATDTERLKEIYATIDALEKSEIETHFYVQYRERFVPFVLWALALVVTEVILGQTRLRTLP